MPVVLVIDDDLSILQLFSTILISGGFAVKLAASGRDGLDILTRGSIDLVVLDLSMPAPDGFELLKHLRAFMPRLPIVVVSGYLEGALLQAAELLGATVALPKGDAPKMLLPAARAALHKKPRMDQ
jgi:CheY-like chemotaxis protein